MTDRPSDAAALPEDRNGRASSLHNKASALYDLGGAENLQAALDAYDEAIALRRQLDIGVPEYCNNLAGSLHNKGSILDSLGDTENLRAALDAYDEAIVLRRQLDISVPEYRNGLASTLNNKGNTLGRRRGAENLRAALDVHDEAIALQRQLDVGIPEYRNDLANSLHNKASSLYSLGGAENLRAALDALDEAIALRSQPDIGVPKHRDDLAWSLDAKGRALQSLGGAGNLWAALDAYDEAIALRRQLDIGIPEYRNNLAGSLTSKGIALDNLGGAENQRAALDAYDEAIALRRQLDIGVPKHRNDLANNLHNRGIVLQRLGGAENLRAALDACDEAIALRRQLDIGVPKFRNDLALSLTQAGIVLHLLGYEPDAAVSFLREAWTLRQPLLAEGPDFHPNVARESRSTPFELMRMLGLTGQWDEATDVGDDALSVERYLYQRGWSNSSERVPLFDMALSIYRGAGSGHLLPELITEQIHAGSPGAAWDSIRMHDIAAAHLDAVIGDMLSRGRHDLLGDLLQARAFLTGLAARYFAGTADSARLRARAAENRGQPRQALAIFDDYIAMRPLDPQGYLVRAHFQHRQKNHAGALEDYAEAARRIVQGTPAPTPEALDDLGSLAKAWLDIQLDDALLRCTVDSDTNSLLETVFDPLQHRLERQRDAVLSHVVGPRQPWEQPLIEQMVHRPWQQVERRRRAVLAERDAQKRAEVIAAARREIADWLDHVSAVVCRALPRPWADFVERVLAAAKELAALPKLDAEAAEVHVGHAIRTAMDNLSRDALAEGDARLAQTLPPDVLAALDPTERRYLSAALASADHPVMAKFTALEIGCAVEYALQKRLFDPLRLAWLEAGEPPPPPRDTDRFGRLHQHLVRYDGPIMLGPLVGALTEAMKQVNGTVDDDLIGAIARYLAQQPGSPLIGMSEELRRERRKRLTYLSEQRNAASHPVELARSARGDKPPHDTAALVLDAALRMQAVAFFRYFPAAAPKPAG